MNLRSTKAVILILPILLTSISCKDINEELLTDAPKTARSKAKTKYSAAQYPVLPKLSAGAVYGTRTNNSWNNTNTIIK